MCKLNLKVVELFVRRDKYDLKTVAIMHYCRFLENHEKSLSGRRKRVRHGIGSFAGALMIVERVNPITCFRRLLVREVMLKMIGHKLLL